MVWTTPRAFPRPRWEGGPPLWIALILALAITLAAHEATHAAAYRLSGSGVRLGAGTHYLYVAADRPVTRETLLLVSLAPLALMSAATLAVGRLSPTSAGLSGAIFALNALGSVGDVVLALKVLGSPGGSLVVDRGDRSLVIPPNGQAGPPGWWALMDSFLRTYPIAFALVGGALALLQGPSMEFQRGVGFRLTIEVSPTAPIAAALISAAASALTATRPRRRGR